VDLDNFNKLGLDVLAASCGTTTARIEDLRLQRAYDKQRPRIEVTVET
jgi:Holliday junction resolvase RusA-like endonuclease